jgi:outer membrane protein
MNFKIFLVAIFLLTISSTSFAQTEKGRFVLSGKTGLNFLFTHITTGVDNVQTGKSKSNEYDYTLGAGLFIADNLSFGVAGTYSYNYSKIESESIIQNITQSFTIIPQLQYYFQLEGKLKPVVFMGGGYVWLQERDSRVATTFSSNIYTLSGPSLAGGAGFSYFVTPCVSFDLGIQYSYAKLKDKLGSEQFQKEKQVAGTMGVSVFF